MNNNNDMQQASLIITPLPHIPLPSQGQRTVYRLTIVKAWNSEEIEAYASLVALGKPDFIEVKGNNG